MIKFFLFVVFSLFVLVKWTPDSKAVVHFSLNDNKTIYSFDCSDCVGLEITGLEQLIDVPVEGIADLELGHARKLSSGKIEVFWSGDTDGILESRILANALIFPGWVETLQACGSMPPRINSFSSEPKAECLPDISFDIVTSVSYFRGLEFFVLLWILFVLTNLSKSSDNSLLNSLFYLLKEKSFLKNDEERLLISKMDVSSFSVGALGAHSICLYLTDIRYRNSFKNLDYLYVDSIFAFFFMRICGISVPRFPGPTLFSQNYREGEDIIFGCNPEISKKNSFNERVIAGGMGTAHDLEIEFSSVINSFDEDVVGNEFSIVWVGVGCPKQDYLSTTLAKKYPVGFAFIGVGAAIDFFFSLKPRAPVFFQTFGIEWVHRLVTEPRKTAGRIRLICKIVILIMIGRF